MSAPTRFPRSVYGVGDEPDPRFSLANERTFLAWIRTALAFLAAGVALEALAVPMPAGLRTAISLILVGVGLLSPVQAWRGWARAERSLRTGGALPSPSASPIVVGGMVLAAVLLVIGLLS
jgi:putative membrane protein